MDAKDTFQGWLAAAYGRVVSDAERVLARQAWDAALEAAANAWQEKLKNGGHFRAGAAADAIRDRHSWRTPPGHTNDFSQRTKTPN